MNPQGSIIYDATYFTALTAKINAIESCAELQGAVTEAFASIQAQKSAIDAQIAQLAPMLALLTLNPSDLPSVITFISDFVAHVLTPYLKPYVTYATQLTDTLAAISALSSAITAAASRIESCSVTIPPIT